MMGNYHARCGAGEKPEVETPEAYLSLFGQIPKFDIDYSEQGTGDYKAKSLYEAGRFDKKVKSGHQRMDKFPKV